jgi:hypothetical protein
MTASSKCALSIVNPQARLSLRRSRHVFRTLQAFASVVVNPSDIHRLFRHQPPGHWNDLFANQDAEQTDQGKDRRGGRARGAFQSEPQASLKADGAELCSGCCTGTRRRTRQRTCAAPRRRTGKRRHSRNRDRCSPADRGHIGRCQRMRKSRPRLRPGKPPRTKYSAPLRSLRGPLKPREISWLS